VFRASGPMTKKNKINKTLTKRSKKKIGLAPNKKKKEKRKKSRDRDLV
jgi:hypothetical protein